MSSNCSQTLGHCSSPMSILKPNKYLFVQLLCNCWIGLHRAGKGDKQTLNSQCPYYWVTRWLTLSKPLCCWQGSCFCVCESNKPISVLSHIFFSFPRTIWKATCLVYLLRLTHGKYEIHLCKTKSLVLLGEDSPIPMTPCPTPQCGQHHVSAAPLNFTT